MRILTKILKIIILQLFLFFSLKVGQTHEMLIYILALGIAFMNFAFFRPSVSKGHYLFTLIFFILFGVFQDSLFEKLSLVDYGQESFPFWLNSLYVIFIAYYADVFNFFDKQSKWFQALVGALGSVLAYGGGAQISAVTVLSPWYFLFLALSWAVFFPISISIYYRGWIWNTILDMSIYYSFDATGYKRHQKEFNDEIIFHKNKSAIVTGGTSGIGLAVAEELARQGVKTYITGRNTQKGQKIEQENQYLTFLELDLADWKRVKALCKQVRSLDYIVLNAGGMPDQYKKNDQGIEEQFASQLYGHYYLLKGLNEDGKLNDGAKIVWVTSGGMYLRILDLSTIEDNPNYEKVSTYANVKRAQVTILDKLKEEFPKQLVFAMHPGWVDTPAVRNAIPEFYNKMGDRLRVSRQGADTILWLLSTCSNLESGALYFDRKKVKKHFYFFTKKSDKLADELYQKLNQQYVLVGNEPNNEDRLS